MHGQGRGASELPAPYGIPFRCLLPRGWKNLLVACRAAGFSHIGASSARLSRTMIQLGQAAGTAAALSAEANVDVADTHPRALRERLVAQYVQLEYPPRPDVAARVAAADE